MDGQRTNPKHTISYYILVALWVCLGVLILAQFCVVAITIFSHTPLTPVRIFPNATDRTNFTTTYGTITTDKRNGFTFWANVVLFIAAIVFVPTLGQRLGTSSSEIYYNVSMLLNILFVIASAVATVAYWVQVPACNANPVPLTGIAGSFDNECNDEYWCGAYGTFVPSCPNFNGTGTWFPPVSPFQLSWNAPFTGGLIVTMLDLIGGLVVFLVSIFTTRSLRRVSDQNDYVQTVDYSDQSTVPLEDVITPGFNNDPSQQQQHSSVNSRQGQNHSFNVHKTA